MDCIPSRPRRYRAVLVSVRRRAGGPGCSTVLQIFGTVFGQPLLPEPTRGLLYALYGAPVLMMLFLPDTHWRTRVKFEIFLDLLQVAIVVGLIYSAFSSSPCG